MSETYIPSARDSVMGYFGRGAHGYWRQKCVCCNDAEPLTEAHKVYGDLYVSDGPLGRMSETDACDVCGVTFLSLSQRCQREHDEQQARFARLPCVGLLEYGILAAPRCRIY